MLMLLYRKKDSLKQQRETPQYTEEELERYEKRGAKITDKGWLQSEDGR